ncbi:hypothetical protein SLE2022_181550 [Rubroshorea leprosula]
MQHPRTKTQILAIFIILFNQLLPIVIAHKSQDSQVALPYKGGHHLHASHHHGHHGQKPRHSPVLEENLDGSHELPSTSHHHDPSPLQGSHDSGGQDKGWSHLPLPMSEEDEFLIAHNKYRSKLGHPPLSWDVNLASFAEWWANKRSVDCEMLHSRMDYGENIFWGARDHWTPTEVVDLWAGEGKFYNPETNMCQPDQICGHYTQIIWTTSSKVGCSRKKCQTGGVFVICSYDPPGNIRGGDPFSPQRHRTLDTGISSLPSIPPLPSPAEAPSQSKHARFTAV